jgi:hypothetical protein
MSRSPWLGRRLAALLQLPVEVIDAEASARGVAFLCGPDISARWDHAPLQRHVPYADAKLIARYRQFCELLGAAG